jgi:hypothetical protein
VVYSRADIALLAPRYIKFYGSDWKELHPALENDKQDPRIQTKILAATSITPFELNSDINRKVPSSRKMQWTANRQVTREEDIAYLLMGVFDVSFSIAYGEGAARAFSRLVQQILHMDSVDDTRRLSLLIPSRPHQYLWRAQTTSVWPVPSIPATLTHLGLHLAVLLTPAISIDESDPNLYPYYPIGDYYGTATIDPVVVNLFAQKSFPWEPGHRYNVLDRASWHNTRNIEHRR